MSEESSIPLSKVGNVSSYRDRLEDVCLKSFSLNAVKNTCYRYAASGFHKLTTEEKEQWAKIHFKIPATLTSKEEEDLITRFHTDLVDQDLRETVQKKTKIVRNLILTNAFADSSLVDDDS